MNYAALEQQARTRHLNILGGFHPAAQDSAPAGCQTILLLGPDEPDFWPAFRKGTEGQDGLPDPMDRWSTRVIGDWAATLDATPLYPFGGPPFQPFYAWALRTGRCHASPVQLLVHDQAGLFVSFRGALALRDCVDLPPAPTPPCRTCAAQPCRTACTAQALTPDGYDVPKCKSFLGSPDGAANMAKGCNVRRACPVSQQFGRLSAQSAFHMRSFTGVSE